MSISVRPPPSMAPVATVGVASFRSFSNVGGPFASTAMPVPTSAHVRSSSPARMLTPPASAGFVRSSSFSSMPPVAAPVLVPASPPSVRMPVVHAVPAVPSVSYAAPPVVYSSPAYQHEPSVRLEPHWMDSEWWLTAPVDFKGLHELPPDVAQRALDRVDNTVRRMDLEGRLPRLPAPPWYLPEQQQDDDPAPREVVPAPYLYGYPRAAYIAPQKQEEESICPIA
eukprot:gnl/TRDRNA2_/TRDRNA2_28170_c0_seq1.p1 gnl/TRDRNA2_/TRDRNA2_28170_c0~~gnl/TRDRNA2_/TRDRNA2_28170_c0_seq1.p1  ORF type:complete len:238 (-),score=41.90 gnl/TRDRNA2_/TRDRNA2_28170_c0_seq1:62-736(-)